MNQNTMSYIKTQLEAIRASESLEYSKGLVDGLIAFVEANTPKEVTLSVVGYRSLIDAIKAVRQYTGMGLAESKQLVETRGPIYKGDNLEEAIRMKRALESHIDLELKGSGTVGLLFAKD